MAHACGPSYLGGWDGRITWVWEVEAAVDSDCVTALQPGCQSETLTQNNNNNNNNKKSSLLLFLFSLQATAFLLHCSIKYDLRISFVHVFFLRIYLSSSLRYHIGILEFKVSKYNLPVSIVKSLIDSYFWKNLLFSLLISSRTQDLFIS